MFVASASSAGIVSLNESTTFLCYSESLEFEVPVFVDTYNGKLPVETNDKRFLRVWDILEADGIYQTLPPSSEFQYYPDKCRLGGNASSQVDSVDISLFVTTETQFGIAYLKPDSSVFSGDLSALAISGSIDLGSSYPILLHRSKPGEAYPIESLSRMCKVPDSDLKPDVVAGTGNVAVSVRSLGFAVGEEMDEFKMDRSGITGLISSSTKGIVLPSSMFDEFVSKAKSIYGKPVELVGQDLIVHECYNDSTSPGFKTDAFSVIVALKGQGDVGIRIMPERYMRIIDHGKCVMEVFRGDQADTMILGDSLFKSSIIEFSSNHGLRICPIWSFRVPEKAAVLPKIEGRFESNDSTKSSSGLLIAILVGGIVLVGGLATWFIMRAKKKRTHVDRFSPTRPMVGDPSDVSSMASAEHL